MPKPIKIVIDDIRTFDKLDGAIYLRTAEEAFRVLQGEWKVIDD